MGKSAPGARRLPALAPIRVPQERSPVRIRIDAPALGFPVARIGFERTRDIPVQASLIAFAGEGYVSHADGTATGYHYPAVSYLAELEHCPYVDAECEDLSPRFAAALRDDYGYQVFMDNSGWEEVTMHGARWFWVRGRPNALGVLRTARGRTLAWHDIDAPPVSAPLGCRCLRGSGDCLHAALARQLGTDPQSVWAELWRASQVGALQHVWGTAATPYGVFSTDAVSLAVQLITRQGGSKSHAMLLRANLANHRSTDHLRLPTVDSVGLTADGGDGFLSCGKCVDERTQGTCYVSLLARSLAARA